MTKCLLLTLLRLLLGLIALIAIFSQLAIQIHNGFSILNFFTTSLICQISSLPPSFYMSRAEFSFVATRSI